MTNLGKYNEGILSGEFLKLPATKDEVKGLLTRIGVDGIQYEEVFITDYETDIDGLTAHLGEYESLDELSYLASLLSKLDKWDLEKFAAALEYGDYTGSVKDLINLTQNLDCYDHLSDISCDDDLGRYYAEEVGSIEIPEHLAPYFDYEAYGRDIALETGGAFTDKGYIASNGEPFTEYYSDRDDLPEEGRVFCSPDSPEKMPVARQLEVYGRMAAAQTMVERSSCSSPERN